MKIQINWHKTNRKLFGPIVEEKKPIKTKNIGKPKNEKPDPQSTRKSNGSLIPISIWQTTNPSSLRTRRIIHAEPKTSSKPNDDLITGITPNEIQHTSLTSKNLILNDKEMSDSPSATVNSVLNLPQTPFYIQEGILYPFPLTINKTHSSSEVKEIYSLPSKRLAMPSVTEVLNKTRSEASELALAAWRKKKVAEVGEDGLKEFMREAALTGKSLHTSLETCLRGVQYENVAVDSRISGHWLSLKEILKEIKTVVAVETYVVHPFLQYKGFVDCIAHYRESLVVIDWKTSQRIKTTLAAAYDDPVQIAAYIGALNADDNYPLEVENALLVVAYPTGRPADVLLLNREECNRYWSEWLKRLELYNQRKRQGLLDRPAFS